MSSNQRAGKAVVTERRSSARIQKLKSDEALRRSEEEARRRSEEEAIAQSEENLRKRMRIQAGKRPMLEVDPVQVSVAYGSSQAYVASGSSQAYVASGSSQAYVASGSSQPYVASGSSQPYVASGSSQAHVASGSSQAHVVSGSSGTIIMYTPHPDVAKLYEKYTVTCIGSSSNSAGPNPYHLVKEALRSFNKNYLHFAQEEEKRANSEKLLKQLSNFPRSRAPTTSKVVKKRRAQRPDLKSITKMKMTREVLKLNTGFGPVPGIDVGHQFFSRAEMVILGFHSHWLSGIDFIGKSARKQYRHMTLPLTRCIVLSGQYEDDMDNSETIIYTGQGGNNLLGDKRQIKDQKMIRGNLGLKNCMEQGVPVRVVRGHNCINSYVKKVYTYDGLYKVEKYWADKGVSGFTVYKFTLVRLDGQPELTTSQVKFIRNQTSESVNKLRGLVCEDITDGQEDVPIPATNVVDEPPVPPTGFTYTRNIQVAKNVKIPKSAPGCNCIGKCKDNKKCSCAQLNGSEFPYVKTQGGRLVEPKAVVFECGPNCACGPECCNRTSQKALRFRLEVFRTPKKGWGIRSWDPIPAGSPVCEYMGVLKKTEDLDASSDNNYIFDIDCLQTMKGLDGREKRLRDVSLSPEMEEIVDNDSDSQPEYCIDAGTVGNVGRFINHCCQPNLFVQCVLSSHHDIRQARIILFAADNIQPLEELTYDYGYALDSVVGPDGEIKKMACYCGAEKCRKRLL